MASKNRIKGITIEIGGDVTKLDSALSKTNKSIKTTQGNLRDVEKLLKMDPKNVELLDQKQRLLSQSVEQTADKYNTLKQALETSTASNVRFDEWTKAQANFQQQITKTENALKGLEQQQKELADLGFSPDSSNMVELQKQIDATKDKSAALRKDMADTYEALGRPISIDQYNALQRELVESEQAMKDAKKAADEFNPSLAKLGATAEDVSNKAKKVADAAKGISTVAAGGLAALGAMAVKAGQYADDINTAANQTGFSTATLQAFDYAANRIDVSFETITSSAAKFKKGMTSTSADVQNAWATLGMSQREWADNGDMEAAFFNVIAGLSKIENEIERDTVAYALFGKSADQLAGIIDDGGAAFQQYRQEAQDLGLILSQDALDGANAFNDGLDTIKAQAKASFTEAGAALAESLLPELANLVEVVSNIVSWFAQLDSGTLKTIGTILLLVAAISPIASLISNVTGAISGVASVASIFASTAGNSVFLTFAKWALIIVAVVAAVTALLAVISALTGKSGELERAMGSVSGATQQTTSGANSAISDARSVRGFASGGVFEPNSPMLAVLGDNRTEREIAAPRSELVDAYGEAMQRYGGGNGATNVNVQFTGSLAQLGRLLNPVVTAEQQRQGPQI